MFSTSGKQKYSPAIKLTDRQLEVLCLMAAGHRDRDISERLQISEQTVKQHVRDIYRRLKAKNRANAVSLAYQAHLLSTEDTADHPQK